MTTSPDGSGAYAHVNGLDLYYERHGQGSGPPLVVLPGSFGTIAALGDLIAALAATRQVIGVELQGHGHTGDVDRPLTFEALAGDVAALIAALGGGPADLFGYSLGGGVALQTAIRHPAAVRKLAVVSAPFRGDGWYPEDRAVMGGISVEGFAGTPPHQAFLQTSPTPDAWPAVVAKVRGLVTSDYDWTAGVAALAAPTLLVVGDGDGVQLSHMVEFFGLLGGGQADGDLAGLPRSALAVLPATTHVGWAPPFHGILTRTPLLVPMLTEFLDAPMPSQG